MPLKASVWPSMAPRIAPCSVHTISALAVQLACGWATAVAENSASAKAAVSDLLSMVRRFIVLPPEIGVCHRSEHPNKCNRSGSAAETPPMADVPLCRGDEANSGCVDACRDPGMTGWDLCPLGHGESPSHLSPARAARNEVPPAKRQPCGRTNRCLLLSER
jgi:hypothetical protein